MGRGIDRLFERRLSRLINTRESRVLQGGCKGVEKESLRVTARGELANTQHPTALGSALCNDLITTDYSEALLELVTPTFNESWELLQFLCDLHQFVYRHLEDELLWATSMPCVLTDDASVPIAHYGRSNAGRMKEVYRTGLGFRYGRKMQTISGVHFNYSFPEHFWPVWADINQQQQDNQAYRSASYFALLRNYRRYGWLILYLFGNSPCLDTSFLTGHPHSLQALTPDTLFEPYATSLRMSDVGYRNPSQAQIHISVNSLDEYIHDLVHATTRPHAEYERIGVQVDGAYRQLNSNLLQIENEYYSFIRPKRVVRPGERPTQALQRGGVEYIEVRALDVSAFDPVGVNQNKLRFLEAFLALCLLKDSPYIDRHEQTLLDANHALVAHQGRAPNLQVVEQGRKVNMHTCALELLDAMVGICELLDSNDPHKPFRSALETQQAKIHDVNLTPSARTLAELRTTGHTFTEFALHMSQAHKAYFLELHPPNVQRLQALQQIAAESQQQQVAIEATDNLSFEAYLARYFGKL